MKFTLSWLKIFLDTEASLETIEKTLTQIGLEVEEIIDRSERLKDFSIAEIIKTEPHPCADKLRICEVKTSSGILSIVCGAPNARAGIKVVLAPVGSIIPNGGFKIKESEIRGVKSQGMLCSSEELLIGDDESDGIIELASTAPLGENFAKYYGLGDPIIHINVTPNRGDCLGIYGIARDLAASGIGKLKEPSIPEIEPRFKTNFTLNIEDKKACFLFTAIEIRNIQHKESPEPLRKLLSDIGISSISPAVDVTNYICFSFGQPMHAYDSDLIEKNISIGRSEKEKFLALNGNEYKIEKDDLCVKAGERPECLAGIIGGKSSACGPETKNLLLEAACFDEVSIAKTGRRLKIDTDSRHRFERGIDREFTIKALKIAAENIISICGGEASEILIAGEPEVKRKEIDFPLNFLEKRIGIILTPEEISEILRKLGFGVEFSGSNAKIIVPSQRNDISTKYDITEEISRIYGYDKIPSIDLPKVKDLKKPDARRISEIKRILAACGYDEAVTYSFMKEEKAKLFAPLKEELRLINPISDDLSYMRPSIVPNLLDIAVKNAARSIKNLSLFEIGPIFAGEYPEDETINIAAIRKGLYREACPHEKSRYFDIFDIKEDLENLFSDSGLSFDSFQIREDAPSYYHPSRSCSLNLGKNRIGYFGQIHPKITKSFDIEDEIHAFEINLSSLPALKRKKKDADSISDFQASERDFAFIIDSGQRIGDILFFVKNVDKSLIKSVNLFDIFEGKSIGENKKSIAFSVTIQASDRTLNDKELSDLSLSIISSIEDKFNCKLRE